MRLVLVGVLVLAVVPFDSGTTASGRARAQGAGAPAQTPAKPAPEPPPQQPIFRAGTDLVRVDVSATVRGDEPVKDLRISDFELTEDDVPQVIEQLQFVSVDGKRTSQLDEPLEIRSKEHARLEAAREDVRLFAIFLDDYHIDKRPDITLPLREVLTKFVNQFGPNDLFVLMDPLTTLYDLKFTRSKQELLNRIRTFEGRRGLSFPVKSPIEEAQLSQRNWMELRSGVTLSALHALAAHLGGLREGRKTILFFSQGPGARPGSPNDDTLKQAMQAANRGNVTIHTIDPRPLGTVRFGGDDMLRRIAYDTGGRAIVNSNDPTEQLQGVMVDASAYYLLGYTPTRRTNDGKFHEIKVRVNRRGVRLAARRGYWAATEKEITAAAEAAATPVNVGLQNALSALSDSVNQRAVSVWTGVAKGDGDRTRLSFTWEATPGQATDKPARLEIQPLDETGTPSMPLQVIGGSPGELPLIAHFHLTPGRHRIRFTVLAANGDVLDRWVNTPTVPDLSKETLMLATPRFLRARNMVELRAIEANPQASPTASTRFGPTDRVLVELELRAPEGQEPQLKIDLLNGQGGVLRTLDAPVLAGGRGRMTLPVASLANSTYVLKIEATAGEQTTQQWVAFRVAR